MDPKFQDASYKGPKAASPYFVETAAGIERSSVRENPFLLG